MTYSLTEGYDYETNESNTSLDVGVFYTRFFSPSWSGRFEVFSQERDFRTFAPVETLTPITLSYFSVEERIVQTALVLNADRRVDLGGHEGRFAIGAGMTLAAVYDQTIARPNPQDPAMGGGPGEVTYFRWGWLFDGGMSVAIDPGFGVFARFRVQQDESAFGESHEAKPADSEAENDIVREFAAFGFHVGAEFGF